MVSCFFLKQKTAYEMRISDWSSDVCSSDLGRLQAGLAHRADELEDAEFGRRLGARGASAWIERLQAADRRQRHRQAGLHAEQAGRAVERRPVAQYPRPEGDRKIGTAA